LAAYSLLWPLQLKLCVSPVTFTFDTQLTLPLFLVCQPTSTPLADDDEDITAAPGACSSSTCDVATSTTLLTPCSAGFVPQVDPVGMASCAPCPAGSYGSVVGSCCVHCPVGTYSSAGATMCLPCPAGTTSPANSASATFCTPCPGGTYSVEGSVCLPCMGRTYSGSGATVCAWCPSMTFASPKSATCTRCTNSFCAISEPDDHIVF
jgi:hypothetical protein